MRLYEYTPFPDANVPYIVYPESQRRVPLRNLLWETLTSTPLPYLSRWIIYRTITSLS